MTGITETQTHAQAEARRTHSQLDSYNIGHRYCLSAMYFFFLMLPTPLIVGWPWEVLPALLLPLRPCLHRFRFTMPFMICVSFRRLTSHFPLKVERAERIRVDGSTHNQSVNGRLNPAQTMLDFSDHTRSGISKLVSAWPVFRFTQS